MTYKKFVSKNQDTVHVVLPMIRTGTVKCYNKDRFKLANKFSDFAAHLK